MVNTLQSRISSIRRWMREPRILWCSEDQSLRTTIEVRQWLPFAIFLITFIWYIAAPSPVAVMSMVALGGMLLSAYLWSLTMARGVRARRVLRFAAMQVGDELEEQIYLENHTIFPVIWAEFVDRSNIPGYTVSSARAAGSDEHINWRVHTICTRRGGFNLGPWELLLGEPFGILLVRQHYLQRQEILVYPPLARLPEHILPHRGAVGDHRPLNQPLRAETIISNTIRAYAPGDPLRHIHWPTTARRIDPYVKVFAPEAASNVWLVPDFDAAVHVGEGDYSSEETMVTVVASLAAALLQQNLSVGLFSGGEKDVVILPRQGQPHLWQILRALAPLNAAAGYPLEETLNRVRALVTGSDLLLVVTPSLDSQWVGELRRVSRIRGARGRAEVILLDPSSFIDSSSGKDQQAAGDGGLVKDRSFSGDLASQFLPVLIEQGITASILRREDVQVIGGYYGEVSRWEFSVTGTGKAVTRKMPRPADLTGGRSRPAH